MAELGTDAANSLALNLNKDRKKDEEKKPGRNEATSPPAKVNSPSQVAIRFEQVRTSRLRPGLSCKHYPYYTLFIFQADKREGLLQDLEFSKSERNKQIFVTFTPEDDDVDKTHPEDPVVVCVGVRRVYRPQLGPQGKIVYIFNNDSRIRQPSLRARHMNADQVIDDETVTVTINLGLDFRTPATKELSEKPPVDGFKPQLSEADTSSCLRRVYRVSYIEHGPKRQTPRCQQCQMDDRKCLTRNVGRENRCAPCNWMGSRCYAADKADPNQENDFGVGKDDDEPGEDKNKLMKKVLQPSGIYLSGKKARRHRKKSLNSGSPTKTSAAKTSDNSPSKAAKRPKPRISEGGSFAQPGEIEGVENHGGIFGIRDDANDCMASEVDSDDSLFFSSKPKSRKSDTKELSDSDKFRGNKGPAMPYAASQEDQAPSSQPKSSQPIMRQSQSSVDPQNMSFNTYVRNSTSQPTNLSLEESIGMDTATTVMPGAQMEDTAAHSTQREESPEDTLMGFDGAGDTPPRARRSMKSGSLSFQGELEDLNISDTEW